jgi:hypothetical protein
MKQHRRSPLRRTLLAGAAMAALAAPAASSGCGGGFDSVSKIEGLRVLAVTEDKPYAQPGEEVSFEMVFEDGYVDPTTKEPVSRPIEILWLGGCFDPDGDAYYGCYSQLGPVLQGAQAALKSGMGLPPDLPIGLGKKFTLTLPEDIISRRPAPSTGPHYGVAYVFFAVCAGTLGPVPPDSSGRAGAFPLGCFDSDGNRLGADSFVPGYTQIYSFEDGRSNGNPTVNAVLFDGESVDEGPDHAVTVKKCDVSDDTRNQPPGCGKQDPFTACKAVKIDVDVPKDVADVDPDGVSEDGKPLHEVVWVDYFADKGDFDSEVRLVSDATTGILPDHSTSWIAPQAPGLATVWAVVHDARGGATVSQRYIKVE